MKPEPNQALEPTTAAVTIRAAARLAPAAVVAHLERWAKKKMLRTIRTVGMHDECIENGRTIYRRSFTTALEDCEGRILATRFGGIWNCHIYEFVRDEPKMKWSFGVPGFSKERIESDGFSGVLSRESAADQRMFVLDPFEWRFDATQSELYFEISDSKAELRATLLAFRLFSACRSD